MIRYFSTLAVAIASAFLTPGAMAEKVVVYREGQLIRPQDVADVLGRTRGISLLDDEPKAAAAPAPEAVAAASVAKTSAPAPAPAPMRRASSKADASALSLPVRFGFDSAEIQPSAREQLDALAQGIKLLPADRVVMVEGHTDAVGTDAYNLELSRARAHAVREYLIRQHGIAAARLKTAGYGEERPLEGSAPTAAENRRVQFRGT